MKKLIIFTVLAICGVAYAQDVVPPTGDEIGAFVENIGGLSALGAMGIAAIIVQGLLLAFRTKFVVLDGKVKLLVIMGLTTVSGVISLLLSGSGVVEALVHSQTLTALQVFGHQLYLHFNQKA